jgi:hypothetical protein
LHCLVDWNPRDALGFVDPGVARQGGQVFLLRIFQFFRASFGAFLFEFRAAGRGSQNDEREQTEEGEEQHHPEPGRENPARLVMLDWFGWRHG